MWFKFVGWFLKKIVFNEILFNEIDQERMKGVLIFARRKGNYLFVQEWTVNFFLQKKASLFSTGEEKVFVSKTFWLLLDSHVHINQVGC